MASTCVLTLVMIVLCDFALSEFRPLHYFNHTGLTTINQNFLVAKLPIALADSRQADLLLMGSSLTLFPCVRCDDDFHGVRTRYDRWYLRNHLFEYNKADYFEHVLKRKLNRDTHILNVAVAGVMMSDQYLILKKYLAAGKRPDAIVLMVAPRDFMDNERADVEKTPVFSILGDFTCLSDMLSKHPSNQEFGEFAIGMFSHLFRNRSEYGTFWTNLAARVTGHPTSMYTASNGQKIDAEMNLKFIDGDESIVGFGKPDYGPKENKLAEMDKYKRIYLPVNEELFRTQTSYLIRFLQLAKKEQLPVILVEMPLTKPNLELLPLPDRLRYSSTLKEVAITYGARLCRPFEVKSFDLTDFEDCAHLNAKGGYKLFEVVANDLAADQKLSEALKGKKTRLSLFPNWSLIF